MKNTKSTPTGTSASRIAAVAIGVMIGLITLSAASAADDDPPTLIFPKQIGAAILGMSQDEIEYVYGTSLKTDLWKLPPYDTPYKNRTAHTEKYVYNGHRLWVTYLGVTAKELETDSSYYRTPSGIGVGSRIPLTRCVPVRGKGYCVRRWGAFRYLACDRNQMWIADSGKRHETILYMKHGRVDDVVVGDPGVILICF